MRLWILTSISLCVLAMTLVLLSWRVFQNFKDPIAVIAIAALITAFVGSVVLLVRGFLQAKSWVRKRFHPSKGA